eukprot:SAG11_NODE_2095_length_3833_cov_4.084092_1_plen_379_part_00
MRSDLLNLAASRPRTRDSVTSPPSTAATMDTAASESVSLMVESVNVRQRSPSWPPNKIDLNEELKKVQRPKRVQKAILISLLVFLNNVVIFLCCAVLVIQYLNVDTASSFGEGFIVAGKLSADAVEISIEREQNAVFRSESADSAVSIEAARSSVSKLALSKETSTWNIANDAVDQLVISKGSAEFLGLSGSAAGGATTTISAHLNTGGHTIFGSPLVLSTGRPIPKETTPNTECESRPANCVANADILLSPGDGADGVRGKLRVDAPMAPVSGDFVLEPEERVRVQKLEGEAASVMLENAQLELLNVAGTACLAAAAGDRAAEALCGGTNTLRTRDGSGDLSISDAIFVQPEDKTVTFAGYDPLASNPAPACCPPAL